MLSREQFLAKFRISEDRFNATDLDWDALKSIYEDHQRRTPELIITGNTIGERLRQIPSVHSLKMRVKNPEHLVEKIIRKKEEAPDRIITLETYRTEITDLVGVRALHLYKDDWVSIHNCLKETWDPMESPVAYYRKGDAIRLFEENGCKAEEHPFGYRSVHYVVGPRLTRDVTLIEIQIRTIFEEGWSEIDHEIRYPYDIDNPVFAACLSVFNRLAGSADEMGSYSRNLKIQWDYQRQQLIKSEEQREEMIKALEAMRAESKRNEKEKTELKKAIDSLKAASVTTVPLYNPGSVGLGAIDPRALRIGDIGLGVFHVPASSVPIFANGSLTLQKACPTCKAPVEGIFIGTCTCTKCGQTFSV